MAKHKNLRMREDDPCLCGSGKPISLCCMTLGGHLRRRPPMLLPTPPRTDHKHVGCYLGETADCSFDLSAEHYMSRSVLEAIGPRVAINGAPWLSAGETREVGISSPCSFVRAILERKVLCDHSRSVHVRLFNNNQIECRLRLMFVN
jgi:hypothetical protein